MTALLELLTAKHVMSVDSHGGQLDLKIDISKAFDSNSWLFVFEALRWFGFFQSFIGWMGTIFILLGFRC